MIPLLVLLGCAKETPPHLRVDTRAEVTVSATDPAAHLESLIRRDPLVRRPKPGPPGAWSDLPDGAALEAWAAVARKGNPTPSDWTEVEKSWPGTLAVPLARGARLAAIEVAMAGELEVDTQQVVSAWLGATRVEARPTTQNPSEPMSWVPGTSDKEKRDSALRMAERSVLLGWLDGPSILILTPALALSTDTYARLAETPVGTLIRARAARERDSDAGTKGRRALQRATFLALAEAAADTDDEQTAYRKRLDEERASMSGTRNPIAAWLERARHGLTADADSDASTGLALITIAAERLEDSCGGGACMGLDRTQSITDATRWDDQTHGPARAWQVIALKRAADTLEVSHDTAGFGHAIPTIAEALSGTGGGTIELPLLRYRVREPTSVVQLSLLAGGPSSADILEAIGAMRARLVSVCDGALAAGQPADHADLIRRIRSRAAQPVAPARD